MKADNRIGEIHNKLKISRVVERKQVISSKGTIKYYIIVECECECGNICNKRLDNVITGGTKSCGCLKKETMKKTGFSNRKELFCYYCGKKHYAKGMCKNCYMCFYRNGTIERKYKTNSNTRKNVQDVSGSF